MVTTAEQKIIEHGVDRLDYLIQDKQEIDADDLHHNLYNEDYFIIGYYNGEQFLNEYGTWDAINEVIEYEQDNFGEVTTDFNGEAIANMLAYIKGQEYLNNCATLQANWGNRLSVKQLKLIKKELQAQA